MSGEVEKCPILHVRPKFDVFTLANDSSSDDESIIEDSAPCHGCKKSVAKNEVCCNFCEHWFCLTCSKLKKVFLSGIKRIP